MCPVVTAGHEVLWRDCRSFYCKAVGTLIFASVLFFGLSATATGMLGYTQEAEAQGSDSGCIACVNNESCYPVFVGGTACTSTTGESGCSTVGDCSSRLDPLPPVML